MILARERSGKIGSKILDHYEFRGRSRLRKETSRAPKPAHGGNPTGRRKYDASFRRPHSGLALRRQGNFRALVGRSGQLVLPQHPPFPTRNSLGRWRARPDKNPLLASCKQQAIALFELGNGGIAREVYQCNTSSVSLFKTFYPK